MSNLIPFKFESHQIRVVTSNDGEPLFVGKDVALALGYNNPNKAMLDHCKGITIRYPLPTSGGTQEMRVLTEADVFRLIVNCKLPAGESFEKLVFEEILPTIRKTGRYETASIEHTQQTKPKEIAETSKAMLSMAKAFGFKGNQALLSADRATQKLINVSPLSLLGAELISENKNKLLTPSDIGEQLGLTARVVNQMLQDLGLQKSYRDAKGNLYWDLTENGTQYAEVVDTVKRHGNGTPVKQIKWQSAIVDTLKSRV